MYRTAFLFPGQGSQEVGMGQDIAGEFKKAKEIFDRADQVLGFSLSGLIKEGPAEELKKTINTQPAVVATSIAIMEVLREEGVRPYITAGHSVGEFTALYCAGVISLEDCILLTRARGEFMHQAGEKYPGTLSAIIGMDLPSVEELCNNSREADVLEVANLNCPGQIVISGSIEAIARAEKMAAEKGVKTVSLKVSAAFHSPLMNEACEKLANRLDQVEFRDAVIPLVSNVTAQLERDGQKIRELMKKQIISRVLWEESIRTMQKEGVEEFIEIGPGKALAGMLKKIDRKINVVNVNDIKSLSRILDKVKV